MCIRTSVSRTRFLPGSRVDPPAVLSSARFFRCVGCGVLSVEMSVIQSVHVLSNSTPRQRTVSQQQQPRRTQ
jgi:hypothetical protein